MTTPGRVTGRWPLVGRRAEIERFRQALAGPGCRGFLIYGSSGVGKTRLADECLRRAQSEGHAAVRAVASPTAALIPLGALAHLLPAEGADGGDGEPATGDPVVLFSRARRTFQALGRQGRPVLLVDDLHLLDPMSLTLITQLLEAGSVFLLGTLRQGEPVPEAVASLWSSDSAVRVDLEDLDLDAVDALLHLALGGPVTSSTLAALWSASSGNVLYLHELVLGASHDGTLAAADGVWSLARPLAGSRRLLELIQSRIGSVDEVGQTVLERLALGQPLGLAGLSELAGIRHLERLESAGLITVMQDGRRQQVMLAHPLHAEAIQAGLPRIRAQAILLDQVRVVERYGARRREDPLRTATWQLDATGTADVRLLLRAARLARYAHDFAALERLVRAALAAGPSAEASMFLGEALFESGRMDEAEQAFAQASTAATSDAQLQRVALARASNMYWGRLRPDLALGVIEEARAALPERLHSELAAMAATVIAFTDRPQAALDMLGGVPLPPGGATTPLRSLGAAPALAMLGRTGEAIGIADAGYAAYCDDPSQFSFLHPTTQLMNRAIALHEAGRLREASAAMTEVVDLAVADKVATVMCTYAWYLGRCILSEGRPRTAERWFRESISVARARGFAAPLKIGLAGLAISLAYQGEADGARAAVAEMAPLLPRLDSQALVPTAEAWSTAAQGDLPGARHILLGAAENASGLGRLTATAMLLHDVARLGRPELVASRLAALARSSDSAMVAARAVHARGAERQDPDMLGDAVERFVAAGALLLAAEAATGAADALRRRGDQRAAAAVAVRAAALARDCEGARTPGLASSDRVAPLTQREREVCLLASRGLASKDIAGRLVLSVRTVDHHLHSAYAKLGITSRVELSEALDLVRGARSE